MTEEQWKIVQANTDAIRMQRDDLRDLLNRARKELPDGHPLQPEIRKALGLAAP